MYHEFCHYEYYEVFLDPVTVQLKPMEIKPADGGIS